MKRLVLSSMCVVLLASPAYGKTGEAQLLELPRSGGVAVKARSYEAPRSSQSFQSPPVAGLSGDSAPLPRPNMCTGLVRGTEFVAFSQSPVCSAFAVHEVRDVPRVPRGPAPASAEDIALLLLDEAVARAERPDLQIAPGRVGLTGLDSFFWVDEPRSLQVSATVPGLSVTAEARPVQYVWDFGDDSRETTNSPGRPWSRKHDGTIAHLYERRGLYDVRVEVIWEARWRVGTGVWQPLGYFSTSDAVDYPVRQIVALLVKPR